MITEVEKALGLVSKQYVENNQNIKIFESRFKQESVNCSYRHPTALYSNCTHPKGDFDMPNCLIDECPLKNEIT
jgi:hypothetical protein